MSLLDLDGPRLLLLSQPLSSGGSDSDELADLLLHVSDTVVNIPGHFAQEYFEGCDGGFGRSAATSRHASACDTNAGAEANGRAHVDIRSELPER